jgi:hypothetical protein
MTTQRLTSFMLIVLAAFTMTSCELVGDVLEVGVWMGVIIVVVIIAIVLWIFRKLKR